MTWEEIKTATEALPVEKKTALWVAIGALIRCFIKDESGVFLSLCSDEDGEGKVLVTTGINAPYEECFRMVRAAYAMFLDAEVDMKCAKENLQ